MKLSLFCRESPGRWRKIGPWFLAFSWFLGLFVGFLAAHAAGSYLIPMVRGALALPASIPCLLAATVLPFLLSAYAVSFSDPRLLLIISWLKACCFGFCACGVSLAFGSAGWLVRFLFLFSDICLIPVLYVFWLRHISGERQCTQRELFWCGASCLAVGSMDYLFVSPFLVTLISS